MKNSSPMYTSQQQLTSSAESVKPCNILPPNSVRLVGELGDVFSLSSYKMTECSLEGEFFIQIVTSELSSSQEANTIDASTRHCILSIL